MDKQELIKEFKKIKPRTEKHQITTQKNMGGGVYAQIEFFEGDTKCQNYILFSKKEKIVEDNVETLIANFYDKTESNHEKELTFNKVFTVTGLIALLLTISVIGYIFYYPDKTVPDILKIVFTSVVSFYFGGQIKSKNSPKGGQ